MDPVEVEEELANVCFAPSLDKKALRETMYKYEDLYLRRLGNKPDDETGGYNMILDAIKRINDKPTRKWWFSAISDGDRWHGRPFSELIEAVVRSWEPGQHAQHAPSLALPIARAPPSRDPVDLAPPRQRVAVRENRIFYSAIGDA